MKRLRICMTTHNRPKCSIITLRSLVNSLKAFGMKQTDYDISIYDDASEKANYKMLLDFTLSLTGIPVMISRSDTNITKMVLRDRHLRSPNNSHYEYSLYLDNDILFTPEAIEVLFVIHNKLPHPDKSVIGEATCKTVKQVLVVEHECVKRKFTYKILNCTENGMGSAVHFAKTKTLLGIGYQKGDSDWEWNPRALKKGYELFVLHGAPRRPALHIPNLLREKNLISKADMTSRLRCWQGRQQGRKSKCGDIYDNEVTFLNGYIYG